MRARAPCDKRRFLRVIAREIVLRHVNRHIGRHVAQILPLERVAVILRVPHQKDLPAVLRFDGVYACDFRAREDLELRHLFDVLAQDRRVSRMRHPELIVKAAEKHEVRLLHRVAEHTEKLLGKRPLGNAIMIVKPRLRAPADVKRRVDVCLRPLHDPAQLRPVVDLFKRKVLHRRAGDDEAVKILVLHLVKRLVKRQHVLLRGIFRYMAPRRDELELNLQGSVSEHAGKLRLRVDLRRHQVQKQNAQRANVLRDGARFGHHEDVFLPERLGRGELIGNFNRHLG